MEAISEVISALRAETATYPDMVRLWMKVMAISYFGGIIFVFHNKRVLWIVAVMALTAASLFAGKLLFPDVSRNFIGAVSHLVLWPVGLLGLWWPVRKRLDLTSKTLFGRIFPIWKYWVSGLIIISLVLDVRSLLGLF